MVQPEEQRNAELSQGRGPHPREAVGTHGRLPYENEVVGRERPPYHPIGVDALSPLLLHVQFPATREEIIDAIGGARIAVGQDRTKTVREVIGAVTPETFLSSAEVESAVQRAWEQIAEPDERGGRNPEGDSLSGRPRR